MYGETAFDSHYITMQALQSKTYIYRQKQLLNATMRDLRKAWAWGHITHLKDNIYRLYFGALINK